MTCSSTDPTDSCSLSGLTTGDNYTFSVTATNAIGTSAPGTGHRHRGRPVGADRCVRHGWPGVGFGLLLAARHQR